MPDFVTTAVGALLKVGIIAVIANEVRGIVLAGPVLYGMYRAGGTGVTLWLGFCSLTGIALSVVGPTLLVRKFRLVPANA